MHEVMTLAPELPQPGNVLGGKYRIERVLGEGVMGVVYEAVHIRLNQKVAVKAPQPAIFAQRELLDRFEREARAAARLRHRNAVRVIDVDVTENGLPYMVMELLRGSDLESELSSRGQFPVEDAVGYVLQAAAAMVEAHGRGIVHRDLKPSNLFLSKESDGSICLKVLDFGVSKVQSENVRITGTQIAMGTPLYMSPEQVRSAKHVDARTDVWSLGVILYELLTGVPPFTGSATGVGAAIVTDPPTSIRVHRPDIPTALEAVVNKAMSKNPAERYATMKDLALALVPFAGAHAPTDVLRWSLAHEVDLSTISVTPSTPSTDDATIEISGSAQSVDLAPPPKSKKLAIAAVLTIAVLVLIIIGLVSQRAQSSAAREPVTPSAAATTATTAPAAPAPSAATASTGATPSATAAAAESTNTVRSAPSAKTHNPAAAAAPKSNVRTPPQPSSAKTSEPSKKAWDNDSPLPPE